MLMAIDSSQSDGVWPVTKVPTPAYFRLAFFFILIWPHSPSLPQKDCPLVCFSLQAVSVLVRGPKSFPPCFHVNQSTKKDSTCVEQAPAKLCRVDWLQDESVLFLELQSTLFVLHQTLLDFCVCRLPLFSRLTHIVSQDLQFEESAVVVGNSLKLDHLGNPEDKIQSQHI